MDTLLTEVPSSLKQLARLVVRGFYSIEDALIIDMLVRNPCMKDDDICELLKFEKKMLRARIATLKNDKFIQVRLKMETGPDGRAQRVNYYHINYKTFVNVVKYKLDHMRRKMDTKERDETSRASFKCPSCLKTFTDLEADQLYDFATGEFCCTFCHELVEEDPSAIPKADSRQVLARFNEQMEPLYNLLQEVEDIKLAPELLEPDPVDLSSLHGLDGGRGGNRGFGDGREWKEWSGEATRGKGLLVQDATVSITFGAEGANSDASHIVKDKPIWMSQSTITGRSILEDEGEVVGLNEVPEDEKEASGSRGPRKGKDESEDIMSVLLAHEKRGSAEPLIPEMETSSNPFDPSNTPSIPVEDSGGVDDIDEMEEVVGEGEVDGENEEDMVHPSLLVGGLRIPLSDITDEIIAKMTPDEKDSYVHLYQEYYSHMYE